MIDNHHVLVKAQTCVYSLVKVKFHACRYFQFIFSCSGLTGWRSRHSPPGLSNVLQLVEASDDAFWDQFWADPSTTVQDIFALVPAAEIRAVREESPSNLATLCYKVSC